MTAKERTLLVDIAEHPIAGISARYHRLGWHPETGNAIKNKIIEQGLAVFEDVPATNTNARIKILTLTTTGIEFLAAQGLAVPVGRRGGAAQEYWRATMRAILERERYTTTEEFPVGAGRTINLHATKGVDEVIVEIETGKSDVKANIQRCRALHGTLMFFFLTTALREKWGDALPAGAVALGPGELDEFAAILHREGVS